ncbi:MAG: hypothetical protein R3C13_14105 [Hyphomonas sp.]
MAAKVVTAPVHVAGEVVEGTAKGVYYVGSAAVRVTGDALDGPDQMVRLDVTMKSGKHVRKTIKAKNLERELNRIEKKGRIVDVEVTPVD